MLLYDADDREGEVDLVVASRSVTPAVIRRMRRDAGGLICSTVPPDLHGRLGLPFYQDLLAEGRTHYPVLRQLAADDIKYDRRSAFALTINHRRTFTGVTDRDRALTISRFARFLASCNGAPAGRIQRRFGREFRSPGHVFLLNAAPGLLAERQGHTELATALVTMAGLPASATICEMMGEDGRALTKRRAIKYARRRSLPFVDGAEVVHAWTAFRRSGGSA